MSVGNSHSILYDHGFIIFAGFVQQPFPEQPSRNIRESTHEVDPTAGPPSDDISAWVDFPSPGNFHNTNPGTSMSSSEIQSDECEFPITSTTFILMISLFRRLHTTSSRATIAQYTRRDTRGRCGDSFRDAQFC